VAHLNKTISSARIAELQCSTFSIVMTTECPEFEGSAYQAARISISVVCHSVKKESALSCVHLVHSQNMVSQYSTIGFVFVVNSNSTGLNA
jgi:hypothetical protein